jgi:hypothetical protein
MHRRDLLKRLVAGGIFFDPAARPSQAPPGNPVPEVRRVLVAFKCHLDIGITGSQSAVLRQFFDRHLPRAIDVAERMRQSGPDRYVWTTGSWLIYEYLEQAGGEQRKRMEQAIANGHIAWHALPFTWQTELLDSSMIAGALGFCRSLDRTFGRRTTGAKMTDVPGHSRGLILPLAEHGVTFLDIGVNGGSTPPEVPPVFVWKAPGGQSLIVMYHRTYGGVVVVPGSDLAIAVVVRRGDNGGPHTVEEVQATYASLRRQFPNATVAASDLTGIAAALDPFRSTLPVVTQEIGDTWIYGVPSDPVKIARFRELSRLRREWIARGRFHTGDGTDLALLCKLLLAAEHTWGTDTKKWLDFDHYRSAGLAAALDQPNYKVLAAGWAEKRANIDSAVASLPADLQTQAQSRLAALRPEQPLPGRIRPQNGPGTIEGKRFLVALDPETGAIRRFLDKATEREWASPANPLALFTYQMLSQADFQAFLARYVTTKADWAEKDFGKPGIEKAGAVSRSWSPQVLRCWTGKDNRASRLLCALRMPAETPELAGLVAWPRKMYLEVVLPEADPAVLVNFSWFQKNPTRLPEALWLTFQPQAPDERNWKLDKVDQPVAPHDVVAGGSRHMHALTTGLTYRDARGALSIDTLDAPVVALGVRSPLCFSNDEPRLSRGAHFCLFNNAWGTNYVQWFGEDMRFRFILRTGPPGAALRSLPE